MIGPAAGGPTSEGDEQASDRAIELARRALADAEGRWRNALHDHSARALAELATTSDRTLDEIDLKAPATPAPPVPPVEPRPCGAPTVQETQAPVGDAALTAALEPSAITDPAPSSASSVHTSTPPGPAASQPNGGTAILGPGPAPIVDRPVVDGGVERSLAWSIIRAVGSGLVLFVIWALYGTAVVQGLHQSRMNAHFRRAPVFEPGRLLTRRPAPGSPVAVLDIPAIGVHQTVVEGVGATELEGAPGRVRTSALPGAPGMTVVVGHRTVDGAPFRNLGALRTGAQLSLTTTTSYSTYAVSRSPSHTRTVPGSSGPSRLLLVTADPPYQVRDTLVVTATSTSGPSITSVGTAPQVVVPRLHGSLLAATGAATILVVLGAGLWASSRGDFGSLPRWSVLAARPIVAVVVLSLYTVVLRALPPTL